MIDESLKMEINDLIWRHSPSETTLEYADKTALAILNLIQCEHNWQYEGGFCSGEKIRKCKVCGIEETANTPY